MTLKFICIASGSSGNCFYLGTSSYGILIDAGMGVRTIRKALRERGIAIESIMGVFITHDHFDHIRSVGNISEEYHIPVYTTQEIHDGIGRNHCMTRKISSTNKRFIIKEEPLQLRDFIITPFEVPHDSTDNVGYHIECDGKTFCFITDIGHITPIVKKYVATANYLILESNYDEEMLMNGRYPADLKRRISGPNGHLSNREAAEFISQECPIHLRNLWLCHRSKENNTQEKAYQTMKLALEGIGKKVGEEVILCALQRTTPSEIYEFA